MKKIGIVFGILLLLSFFMIQPVSAAEIDEEVVLAWDWGPECPIPPEAPDLKWHLFMRLEDETYDYTSPALIEPYEGDLQLSYNLVIDGVENHETIRVYFVLRSFYNGSESDDSNEVFADFTATIDPPTNLRIVVP